MCGILGVHTRSDLLDIRHGVYTSLKTLSHRGPDDMGIWVDDSNSIALGHTRLSILDLTNAGHQPMKSASGRYIMVFNGEIYNHNDLRNRLTSINGSINWHGHSDTETLLQCFEILGVEGALKSVIGMFSIALWDRKLKKLILAVDRFSEKPLYYGFNSGVFSFASELKAIKSLPGISLEIDRNSISDYFRYQYIPKPQTIYKDIYKLTAGSWLEITLDSLINKNKPIVKQYWSAMQAAYNGENNLLEFISDKDAKNQLNDLLNKSVSRQMLSDVPIGAFLSGGVDSSVVAAIMQSNSMNPIETFSIGFNESMFDESIYAGKVAKHIGANHTSHYLSSDDVKSIIPNISSIYDEPFADSSQIPTFFLSQIAKRKVTVSLSGDGGDEIFGGYNRYFAANGAWGRALNLPPYIRNKIISIIFSVSPSAWNTAYNSIKGVIPKNKRVGLFGDKLYKYASILQCNTVHKLYNRLTRLYFPDDFVHGVNYINKCEIPWFESTNPVSKMMILDTLGYLTDDILTKVDRAAMANSLETRMPLLDQNIFEFAWRLPQQYKIRNNEGKWLLRQVLYDYVPKELIERPKMGFGIPVDDWLRDELKEWAGDTLSSNSVNSNGFLNSHYIDILWSEHINRDRNRGSEIWTVLMFEDWINSSKL